MKLYAMVSSERARKGQGGNKDILTVITAEIDGWRTEIASMSVVVHETTGNYIFRATLPDGSKIEEVIKGKKQKDDDWCNECMSHGCKQL